MSGSNPLNLTPEKCAEILAAINALPTLAERLQMPRSKPGRRSVPIQPQAREVFLEKLARCKVTATHSRPYDVSQLHKKWKGQCVYCGRHLPHPYDVTEETPRSIVPCKEHLVPLAMGSGKHSKGVLSCIGCNTAKSNKDWLDFGYARTPAVKKKLEAERLMLGRGSFNHWARDPKIHTPLKVGRMLDARWQHPRFKVYAAVTSGGSFIGWRSSWPMPQAALFILKGMKGKFVSVAHGYTTLNVHEFEHPEDAIEAIWALIDHNAWVLGFDMEAEGYREITPATDASWHWWSPNFKDLCKRTLTKARPRKPKWARRERE